ncbi:hypothetical protein H8L32_21160 [Undibacterium sp. CY18W]|uniref:Uncharacterized protein n=1 Tax=Undibacterium hunanense TaxID=2762292 RepID=A0ABR6ZVV1_9BURK|nr:hypothetical protein [Undibacterium hunanense]
MILQTAWIRERIEAAHAVYVRHPDAIGGARLYQCATEHCMAWMTPFRNVRQRTDRSMEQAYNDNLQAQNI